ncbi:MAG TPA: ABC transporter permease [Candidatus Baltobacteraceae bacterium]|jgi:ABC-type Na+ efflux pump permease subunit|nr:ABC transporter permease [Candidatus Baltobacteraceae bacterium]
MTFLPVVERELRVAARRRGTYLVRLAAVAVGMGATAWVLMLGPGSTRSTGWVLFEVLAVLLFIYAGIFGTQATADCMSEEKREGTLGLLFLTDLKGYDVVFGKLAATSLHWFYGMLAVVPVLAIPVLMGGVGRGELLRIVLVSVNLLFFSLSIGLWASALCRRDSRAQGLALVAALAIMFAWPAATQLKRHPNPNPRLALLSSPAYGCVLAFDNVYNRNQHLEFWLNALTTQFYSWTFLGLACWIAPRSWQDSVEGKNSHWWRWRGLSSNRSERRRKLLALNPFLWRTSRSGFKQAAVWLMLAIVAALWTWIHWLARRSQPGDNFNPAINLAFLIWAGLMLKAWVAAASGRALGDDRRSGALELLLGTGLRPDEIARGQLWALWRQFAPPIGAVLVANLLCLLVELRYMPTTYGNDRTNAICAHSVLGVFLVLDSIALSWVGMWHGFAARKPNRAVGPAMLRIVVLPVLVFFLLGTFSSMTSAGFDWVSSVAYWCVLGVGADSIGVFARHRLLGRFRKIVSEGYVRGRLVEIRPETAPALAEVS